MFAVSADNSTGVNRTLHKNKRALACGKADEEYLLTTKLFCGKCGALMFGESGTSATGRTYYYYKFIFFCFAPRQGWHASKQLRFIPFYANYCRKFKICLKRFLHNVKIVTLLL